MTTPRHSRTAAPPSLFDAPGNHMGNTTCRGCHGLHEPDCAACGGRARHWLDADDKHEHELALCNRCYRLVSELHDAAEDKAAAAGTYTPEQRRQADQASHQAWAKRKRQNDPAWAERERQAHADQQRKKRQANARARYARQHEQGQQEKQAS